MVVFIEPRAISEGVETFRFGPSGVQFGSDLGAIWIRSGTERVGRE